MEVVAVMIDALPQPSTGCTNPFCKPSRTLHAGDKKDTDRGGQYGDRPGIPTHGVSQPTEIPFLRDVQHFSFSSYFLPRLREENATRAH
jgi:hypothetical protein